MQLVCRLLSKGSPTTYINSQLRYSQSFTGRESLTVLVNVSDKAVVIGGSYKSVQ
jgi:hypothetical protein